jgi:hypothetical protein
MRPMCGHSLCTFYPSPKVVTDLHLVGFFELEPMWPGIVHEPPNSDTPDKPRLQHQAESAVLLLAVKEVGVAINMTLQ